MSLMKQPASGPQQQKTHPNLRFLFPNCLKLLAQLGNLGLDAGLALLQRQLLLAVLEGLGLPLLLGLLGRVADVLLEGVGADLLVRLGIQLLERVGLDLVLNVLDELALVALLIIIGKSLHVLSDVAAEDVLLENLGIQLLGLNVVAGEAVLGVGDEDATVRSALHDAKDAGTGRGAGQTDVEVGLEGAALLAVLALDGLGELVLAIGLLDTGELLVEAELGQDAAGEQKTGGIGGGPVGQAVLDAVGAQLVRVGRGEDLVTVDLGGDDLGDDVAVGEADNQAVLGRIVLVLGLGDEALAGVVVGLALPPALELGLEAAGKELLVDYPPRRNRVEFSAVLTCSRRCS
jgi:hypothetical protein